MFIPFFSFISQIGKLTLKSPCGKSVLIKLLYCAADFRDLKLFQFTFTGELSRKKFEVSWFLSLLHPASGTFVSFACSILPAHSSMNVSVCRESGKIFVEQVLLVAGIQFRTKA